MITYYKRTIKDQELKPIQDFEKGCWIHVKDPNPREISLLHKNFDLDKQNLISGLDQNEIPRAEFIDKDVYVFLNTISGDKQEINTILIIIGHNYVLTLSQSDPQFIKTILDGKVELFTTQKLKFLLKMFSMNNKEFDTSTLTVVKSVSSKKESFSQLTEKDINSMLVYESVLNNFVSSYYYMNLVYERITKSIKFYEQDKEIIEDLMIEAQQGLDLCRSSLKIIGNIRNHYMILLQNKLNKVITLLTILTVFVSVPAAISGLYGMNVPLPFQESGFSWIIVVLAILVVWILFTMYFKKKKIL